MKLPSNPIMSLTQAAMALAESDRVDVALAAERCLHNLDKSSGCEICAQACPVDAIALESGEGKTVVRHDGETCVKCGLCLRVCPVEAYTGDSGVPTLLAYVFGQEKRAIVELGCALHPNIRQGPPQVEVVVNTGACLAAVGPSAIMSLIALGVAHVILRVDVCQACPLAQSRAEIEKTVHQVNHLLETDEGLESPVTLLDAIRETWPLRTVAAVKAPPRSRREFFRAFIAPEELPRHVKHLMLGDIPEAGKHPPVERLRLLRALNVIPPEWRSSEPLESFQTTMIAADENCTACGICGRVCPTEAMTFNTDEEDHYQLSFAAGACTACGVCINLCEPGALHQARTPVLDDWLAEMPSVRRSGDLRRCRKCGVGFDSRSESNFCQVCDYRQKNPFGSQLPKGFKRQREAPGSDDIRH